MGLAVFDSSVQPSTSNDCQQNNGGCSFLCLLKPNGYSCVCPFGMVLGNDSKTCTEGCQQPCLYVSNTTHILLVSASFGHHPLPILSNLTRAVALDVHVTRKLIFWSDVTDKSIKRANTDGSNMAVIVSDSIGVCDGLAVEWSTDLLYWTDTTYDTIEVAHLDGSRRRVLISANLDEPRGIAVDPLSGMMFWTDWGTNPKIESAYLNGENRQAIITSSLGWPNDIALDYTPKKFYWVDAKTDKIESADYSGTNRKQLFSHAGIHPYSVALLDPWLYWTDWSNAYSGLHQIYKATGGYSQKKAIPGPIIMGLTVFDSSVQPTTSNDCQQNNGGCSFLCLLKPNGYSCACANGTTLGGDGKTCNAHAVSCPTLVSPRFGSVTPSACLTSIKYNDVCSFACTSGFRIRGTLTRTCGSDGKWTGQNDTVCEDLQPPVFTSCPGNIVKYADKDRTARITWNPPTATDNSGVSPHISILGVSTPPVQLGEGVYHVNYTATDQANNTAVCSFSITVKVINCTFLIPNGVLQKTGCDNHYGGTCNFTCPIGYRLVGMATLTCLATNGGPPGVWNKAMPRCEAIVCPALTTPANAMKSNCHGQAHESVGTVCQFSCVHGFQPVIVQSRTCHANSTWSGNTLVCYAISCSTLVSPRFGSVTPSACLTSIKYNDVCSFACTSGFRIRGTLTRTCGSDGKWTGKNDTVCDDVTLPTFSNTCSRDKVYQLGACSTNTTVNWTRPVATDNSGTVTLKGPSLQSPATLTPGLYTINYTAEDPSGNSRTCVFKIQVVKTICRNLTPPVNGLIISTSCSNLLGSIAVVACKSGYFGSTTRTCLPSGQWSGVPPTCNRVTCPSLNRLPFGTIKPNPCTTGLPVVSGTWCIFKCNTIGGFQNVGPGQATCRANGTWSVDVNQISCKDVQPPSLQCPNDVSINTDKGKAVATYSWAVPVPHDNSGENLTVSVSPDGVSPPHQFPLGKNVIRFSTNDSSGLQSSCLLVVTVKDVEPPTKVKCPPSMTINSKKEYTKVYLPRAVFKDNVKVTIITTDFTNGTKMRLGDYDITYTAFDQSGNTAKCILRLSITSNACQRPLPPADGGLACDVISAMMHCTVHCNPGFTFVATPNKLYMCNFNGKWFVQNRKVAKPIIPDCTALSSASVELEGDLHYLTDNCNEQNPAEVRQKFMDNLKSMFKNWGILDDYCAIANDCGLENVRVTCSSTSVAKRRRSTDNAETLIIHFKMKIPLPKNSSSVNINQTMADVRTSVFEKINKSVSHFEVNGVKMTLLKSSTLNVVGLTCAEGQVIKGIKCAGCPPGYYFASSSKSCSPCPVNHFQENEGKTSCLACPSGTSTGENTGSKSCVKDGKATSQKPTSVVVAAVVVPIVILIILCAIAFVLFKRYKRSGLTRTDTDKQRVVNRNKTMCTDNPIYEPATTNNGGQDGHIYASIDDYTTLAFQNQGFTVSNA